MTGAGRGDVERAAGICKVRVERREKRVENAIIKGTRRGWKMKDRGTRIRKSERWEGERAKRRDE